MLKNRTYVKLTQWEHWPTLVYYLPLIPFFIYRSIRAKHLIHFLATNPSILYSGSGTESKFETLLLIPEKYRPKSLLFLRQNKADNLLNKLKSNHFKFPFIVKPNIGFRGYLVKKISNKNELLRYINTFDEDILIQEFIPYHNELGLFYHRIPGEKKGKITSITIKKFISVTGDGKSTLSDLINKDDRAFLYHDIFKNIHGQNMSSIVESRKEIILTEIGNHSKGTEFINGNHLIDYKLEALINKICLPIEGFYYGRLDIKYKDYNSLLLGEDFKILEINGIISEPTHIYDAKHEKAGFLNSVKTINKHWEIMDKIAVKNHTEFHVPYPKVIPYLKNLRWLKAYSKKLKKLSRNGF